MSHHGYAGDLSNLTQGPPKPIASRNTAGSKLSGGSQGADGVLNATPRFNRTASQGADGVPNATPRFNRTDSQGADGVPNARPRR